MYAYIYLCRFYLRTDEPRSLSFSVIFLISARHMNCSRAIVREFFRNDCRSSLFAASSCSS